MSTMKVAIITGASNGMGLAACNTFLAAGWSVFGVDVVPAPSNISDSSFQFLQVDLTASDAPKEIVSSCLQAFGGKIDALINVAGVLDYFSSAATVTDETWDRIISINLTAPVRLMREVIPVMKMQRSGSIVNVSSKAGQSGASAGVAYTASKHGLVGVTKNTAWLLKDDGIRCNAICPGAVRTNLFNNVDATKFDQEALSRIKVVNDIHFNEGTGEGSVDPAVPADVLLFLASDLSRGLNGAIVPCDNAFSVI